MKILFALCAILAVATARTVITADVEENHHLLGVKSCTWGPSYWCQNITTSSECHSTSHCIKSVWESMVVPEDTDTVCGVCKDMVKQARDQLESNQTQQDIKAVFEGSCKLIYIKPIVEECIKLVDQFIPELIETLSSQMNPSVVCSVAGLCNSPRIDALLSKYQKSQFENVKLKSISLGKDELEPNECSKCYTVAVHMEYKLNNTSRDKMLEQMLNLCGELSSLSDACSSIILNYFNTIYSHLKQNFNAANICHLSGQCSNVFHKHDDVAAMSPNVEVRPLSSVGMVEIDDDLPCKLCEQLVGHLRDLLVANVTVEEFREVLEGLCKQTKSFATECKAIVEEYYPALYEYLMHRLNTNAICQMSGICPAPNKEIYNSGSIWPLVPMKSAQIGVRIFDERQKNQKSNSINVAHENKSEAEEMQLPIDKLYAPFITLQMPGANVQGTQTCALCEYVLHYVQQVITDPATEEEVKVVIRRICTKVPNSIENNCKEFINTYGDVVVALLAEEIDPSKICPMIHVCPSKELLDIWEHIPKGYMIEEHDKPSCSLCLLAITQIYDVIKNNKTEANIENELDKLCNHLPNSLNEQCNDLVKSYSKELIEMLLADLTPQEICVYIKLCDPTENIEPSNFFPLDKNGEIATNEIPNFPLYPASQKNLGDVACVMCEFVMEHIDKAMGSKKTRDEIEHIVYKTCHFFPKTISEECNDFVSRYGDVVIEILSQEISPKEVCGMISLCKVNLKQIKDSIAECSLCQSIISVIDKLLNNSEVDDEIENVVSKACKFVPASKQNKCVMMMEIYEQSIINILKAHGDPKHICSKIALCSGNDYLAMSAKFSRLRRSYETPARRCTWGESYWCSSYETAVECKALDHCKEKVWKADSAPATKQAVIT